MAEDASSLPVSTRIKACNECRRQKMRCDALQKSPDPCSRCQRVGKQCLMTAARAPKRKSKSELHAEIDALKRQLGSRDNALNSLPHIASPVSGEPSSTVNISSLSQAPCSSSPTENLLPVTDESSSREGGRAQSPATLDAAFRTQTEGVTESRVLNDFIVTGSEIDDCFAQFQQYYAHQVPLLEDAKVPNDYYNRSPLLFWTIVAIGSRRYSKNPVLISSLAPGVKALAREGIFTRDAPISTVASTIISAILLATWPIPFDTLWREETPILLGAAFQLGLSIGLHVYGVGQDFSRIKLAQDKAQMDYRARVWTVLLYTYQRSSFTNGTPPVVMPDMFNHYYYSEQAISALPSNIQFQKKLNTIQVDAVLEIERVALSRHPRRRAELMTPIIDGAYGKLSSLDSECTEVIQYFHVQCAELQILSFHLFLPREELSTVKLVRMYDLACAAIETVARLEESQSYAEYAPMDVIKYLMLAAVAILKIGRCHVRQSLNSERGKAAYFAVIRIARKATVEPADIAARTSTILTHLWNSKTIFKKEDGTFDSLSLRCGSRFAMSMTFDCLWWWRTEFAGHPNPYDGKSGNGNVHSQGPLSISQTSLNNSFALADPQRNIDQSFAAASWEMAQDFMPIDWSTFGMTLEL